jgi:HSP20 family protein
MSLVSYEPWLGARQLQDDINRLFSGWSTNDSSGVTADWVPNVDINELEGQFQLFVDLPGVDPKDVEITLEKCHQPPCRARDWTILSALHTP